MNIPRSFVSLLLALTITGAAPHAQSKPKAPADVLVVADVLEKDPAVRVRPEPGKPIYYFVLGKMERDLGSPYGGVKSPDPEVVHRELTKALASQGYLETKIGGPSPQIVLVVTWGQANLATDNITESVDSTDAATGETTSTDVTTTISYNRREMAQLVGADKAARKLMSSSEVEEINQNLRSDRLYIFVGALDAQALRKKEKKVVWRTRISIDSLREDLNDNLQHMFADAAPYFGRNEEGPVTIDESVRRANVKLGELKFLDDAPAAKPAPAPKK